MSSVHAAAAAGDTCNTHKSEAQMEIEKTTNKKVNKKKKNTEYDPRHHSTAEAMYFQWSWTSVAAELCRPLRLQIGKYGKKY